MFKNIRHLAINIRKMSTNKKNISIKNIKFESKSKYFERKSLNLRERVKVLNEIKLIEYQREFQDQRRHRLSPIDPNQYKQWLSTLCAQQNDSPLGFQQKFTKIQTICRLYNNCLKLTYRVPTRMTTDVVNSLLELDIEEVVNKQIDYLFELEFKRWTEKELRKQDVRRNKIRLDLKNSGNTSRIGVFNESNEIIYGLWHNTLFTRIKPNSGRNYVIRTQLKNSALFGQKICIDFGFEEFLNTISSKQLMSFLVKMFSFNKNRLKESFDLTFANLNPSGSLTKLMDKYFNKHPLIDYYVDCYSDSYLNHLDFDKLCYICPQADEPLVEYDQNAIYILPGVVSHRMDPPLSYMRVRHEGIRMKRIPVEDYAPIREGFHLELSNSLQILSHLRDFNDMSEALELYLPKTVWKSEQDIIDEDEERVKKLFYLKMIDNQRKVKVYRKLDE